MDLGRENIQEDFLFNRKGHKVVLSEISDFGIGISDLGIKNLHGEAQRRHRGPQSYNFITDFSAPTWGVPRLREGGRIKGISDFGIGISDLGIKNLHRETQRYYV
jgi:sensor c-di-GMP phosphodiesterase-like protein